MENLNNDDYEYVSNIDNDLICSVCLNIFIEPIIHDNSENMFCKKCPLCRNNISEKNITYIVPHYISNKLNDVKIYISLNRKHQIFR